MALKKSEKRMLIILGIVVVIVIIFQVVTKDKDKQTTTKPSVAKSLNAPDNAMSSSTAQSQATQSSKKLGERKTFDSWGDNPFSTSSRQQRKKQSVSAETEAQNILPEHKFLGVFEALGKKYALIDDLIIAEGEIKEGIKVMKIEVNSVTCEERGKIFSLYWSE
ncbi:MAG: hypothetical protein R6V04_12605 [bacterium]